MRTILSILFTILLTPVAFAQTDSTGSSSAGISNYGDVTASSTWNRVSGKPATATRWPTWNEVTNKPTTFPPASHNHDSRYDARYVRQGTSGSVNGNLSVSGTVSGNRIVTGDVGGDRWCRATTSGRIQCTYNKPNAGGIVGGGRTQGTACTSWGEATCDGRTLRCPSGSARRTTSSVTTTRNTTTPGCDGGCHSTTTSTTTYSMCVGT